MFLYYGMCEAIKHWLQLYISYLLTVGVMTAIVFILLHIPSQMVAEVGSLGVIYVGSPIKAVNEM